MAHVCKSPFYHSVNSSVNFTMAPREQSLTTRSSSVASYSVNGPGPDFCKGLPKAELHLHIEGSLEPEMMFQLAQQNNITLPYDTVEELRQAYQFNNLQEFLDLYYQGGKVLVQEGDFEALMYAYLQRAHEDGVVRAEVFFDPQTHTARGVSFDTFLRGFERAIQRAEAVFGISTALIMCFLRHLPVADALETWYQAEEYVKDGTIIGVGLDSSEKDFPPEQFKPVFELAKQAGLYRVAHAGEEGPPEYVVSALDNLSISRVDHGVRSEEDPVLVQRLVDAQIALTVCPFSNLALKVVDKLEEQNLKRLLEQGVAVTINSDDPAYFGGYIAENYRATAEALDLTQEQVIQIARNSLQATFASDEQKHVWLAKLDAYVQKEASPKVTEGSVTTPDPITTAPRVIL